MLLKVSICPYDIAGDSSHGIAARDRVKAFSIHGGVVADRIVGTPPTIMGLACPISRYQALS
jgi:hypothetical protein